MIQYDDTRRCIIFCLDGNLYAKVKANGVFSDFEDKLR